MANMLTEEEVTALLGVVTEGDGYGLRVAFMNSLRTTRFLARQLEPYNLSTEQLRRESQDYYRLMEEIRGYIGIKLPDRKVIDDTNADIERVNRTIK